MKPNQGGAAVSDKPKLPAGKVTSKEVEINKIEVFWGTTKDGKRTLQFVVRMRMDRKSPEGELYSHYWTQYLPFSIRQDKGYPILKNNSRLFRFLQDVSGLTIQVDKEGYAIGDLLPDYGFPIFGGVDPEKQHEVHERLGYFNTCIPNSDEWWNAKRAGEQVDDPALRYFKLGDVEFIGMKFNASFTVTPEGYINDLKRYVPVQEVEI
jgi:hypothetical protein